MERANIQITLAKKDAEHDPATYGQEWNYGTLYAGELDIRRHRGRACGAAGESWRSPPDSGGRYTPIRAVDSTGNIAPVRTPEPEASSSNLY
jgi:hypothetical protein